MPLTLDPVFLPGKGNSSGFLARYRIYARWGCRNSFVFKHSTKIYSA